MAGYTRQSAASIVPTAVVRATPLNDEFNALRDAFVVASGHKHDGTTAEGAYIPLISDTNSRNKLVVDPTNNRLGVFVNVSSTAVEQLRFVDGALVPVVDNDIDLGSSSFEFKDLYIDGTANIDGLIADTASILSGTINNAVIGNTTPAAITGTLITATTGFSGTLTGDVIGNVTASSGTSTFNNATVNGTLSATLSGNVNATSGTSTFNNVTITGTLNMDAGTTATITNLSAPVNSGDAATKGYVDNAINNLIGSAPGTLDTLGEIADALNDDANIAATLTNQIAAKVSKSGDTMTGALAMGTNKITGLGDPTASQDAATKAYVDTQRDSRLALSGGTMTGAIAMGTNKITGLGDPTANQDAATKNYIDTIFGSTTSAAASAAAAAVSASNAATSASNASTSATNAAASASAAAASFDSFDDRYLGPKSSNPTLDNDGNALLTGALYFNTTAGEMRVWNGSAWLTAYLPATNYLALSGGTMTGNITFAGTQTFAGSGVTGNISGNAANVTGTVAVANGGTGQIGTPTNGQLLIGNGTGFTRATLTAGTGITITNGSGTITIAGSASPQPFSYFCGNF